MANMRMHCADQCLLRKRAIIESVNAQLKNISQIEHSRHRSSTNFLVNLVGGLIAYCFQPKMNANTCRWNDDWSVASNVSATM